MAQDEKMMLRFQPKRGPNREENFSLFLEQLWGIANHDAIVQRKQLGNVNKIRTYILELEKRGYISLVSDVARGNPLLYVMLLKKSFEAKDRVRKARVEKDKRSTTKQPHDMRETSLAVFSGEAVVLQPTVEIIREINGIPVPRSRKDETPHAIAFIDFPNIASKGGGDKQNDDYYDIGLYRFNPMGLMGCFSYAGGDVVLVNEAYAYFKRPWSNEAAVTKRMEAAHIVPVYSSVGREDIDKIMLTHMMSKCYERLEDTSFLLMIVVSGDHAFAHPIQAIKEAGHKKQVFVFAKIVSWKGKLASLLEQQADEVMYIDDIHEFIDPLGYKIGQTA